MCSPARLNALAVGEERCSYEVEQFDELVHAFKVLTARLEDTSDPNERMELIRTARRLVVESRELSRRVQQRIDAKPKPPKHLGNRMSTPRVHQGGRG